MVRSEGGNEEPVRPAHFRVDPHMASGKVMEESTKWHFELNNREDWKQDGMIDLLLRFKSGGHEEANPLSSVTRGPAG